MTLTLYFCDLDLIIFLSSPSPSRPLRFQINIKQLKDKIENLKTEIEEKSGDATTHIEHKTEARGELQELITKCEELYNEYDTARIQVRVI
jgi:archaellum component FlaC